MRPLAVRRGLAFASAAALLAGCAGMAGIREGGRTRLVEVARSERQWTGVAVSKEGRIFVNYPRWSDSVPFSVGELTKDGKAGPYPSLEWNTWDPSLSSRYNFICVQSVYIDGENFLWILDPANPRFQGVVRNGPKLLKVDLATDRVIQTISFDESVAPPNSYLNDVRVDTGRRVAYLTDSGAGAIVVVDLAAERSRRVLAGHSSVRSEGITLTIGGGPWRLPDGKVPQVHADGIALDPSGEHLYYQALTGRHLYRIATRWLLDASLGPEELAQKVERVGRTGAADGIAFGPDGRLYLTAIEEDAVNRLAPEGKAETVLRDPRLAWPDSLAPGPDGSMYVTTSQIHRGAAPPEPYRIFRFRVPSPQ